MQSTKNLIVAGFSKTTQSCERWLIELLQTYST